MTGQPGARKGSFDGARGHGGGGELLDEPCRRMPRSSALSRPAAGGCERARPLAALWSLRRLVEIGPTPLVPTGTAVPTLVLAGEFDPVTRPYESQHVAALIGPHARWVVFPRVGHNVRAFSPCGAKIAGDFIDNPARTPDTSCADRAAPIRFLPK